MLAFTCKCTVLAVHVYWAFTQEITVLCGISCFLTEFERFLRPDGNVEVPVWALRDENGHIDPQRWLALAAYQRDCYFRAFRGERAMQVAAQRDYEDFRDFCVDSMFIEYGAVIDASPYNATAPPTPVASTPKRVTGRVYKTCTVMSRASISF